MSNTTNSGDRMSGEPGRVDWLERRDKLCSTLSYSLKQADRVMYNVLGPCPPESTPTYWRTARIGGLVVTCHADGGVWVGFPDSVHEKLTSNEADAMAAALTEHAHYIREQEALSGPPICGRVLDTIPFRSSERQGVPDRPLCVRPEGHPGVCRPHQIAGDEELQYAKSHTAVQYEPICGRLLVGPPGSRVPVLGPAHLLCQRPKGHDGGCRPGDEAAREEIERMRREMLEGYAPTTKLPEETRSGVKGTVVDGDVL